ncbi:MAG TPA: glycosyltransferase N-terminal domain-containing protein [Gemmatimonadaceae bacterium]|nr:glycosyltransferase N-terminal domain-containing protein [Gemmatimonadaceae bacterium]
MNSLLRIPYAVAGAAARSLAGIVPDGESKLRKGLHARREILDRYHAWGDAYRDLSRPLLWMHAPSVGEGLQALPVLKLMRERRPAAQLVYTFFSPSAEKFASSLDVDFADYLPFDSFSDAAEIIASLQPSALVFSKLDIWPALTESAAAAYVKVGVISATLSATSARRSALAKQLLGDAYAVLDRVGAISGEDAGRFLAQGVRRETVSVTGDTRYDQVWARALAAPALPLVAAARSPRPTLVAGSTWPADERHLLAAWITVRDRIPDARLLIAPHELSDETRQTIFAWATEHALRVATLGDESAAAADVVFVDRYGLLGDLYAVADAAFVGGGFHGAGLHSVLEPAAFGVPVLYGPRHEKSRDAIELARAGGGFVVTTTDYLAGRLVELLQGGPRRDEAGAAAKAMVSAGLGAAERSFKLVTSLLDRS